MSKLDLQAEIRSLQKYRKEAESLILKKVLQNIRLR